MKVVQGTETEDITFPLTNGFIHAVYPLVFAMPLGVSDAHGDTPPVLCSKGGAAIWTQRLCRFGMSTDELAKESRPRSGPQFLAETRVIHSPAWCVKHIALDCIYKQLLILHVCIS